jgi:hypothetical protein
MNLRTIILIALVTPAFASTDAVAAKTSFAEDVAPIFFQRCVECHRPNAVAPMSLLTYKEARPWAKSIRKAVATREMPPWDADPEIGHFKNDISLTQEEIDTIVAWVDQGTPAGNLELMPEPPTYKEGWKLGEPDYVVELPKYDVAADGEDGFPNIFVNLDVDEKKYIRAIELEAGDSTVLHHVVLFKGTIALGEEVIDIRTTKKAPSIRPDTIGTMYVWAAGSPPAVFPKGTGHSVETGQAISISAHYHPSGSATTDRSRIGLYFADEPLEKELTTAFAVNPSLRIPPHSKGYEQRAYYSFSQDSKIISFLPHMHTRGDSMRYTLHYPDGKTKDVLNVPKYNYDWQWIYYPEEPIAVPAGTSMEVVASYDNSHENEKNPNPHKWVEFGDGTDDEMMVGFAEFIVDDGIAPVHQKEEDRLRLAMRLHDSADCFIVDAGILKAGVFLPKEGDGMMYVVQADAMVSSSLLDLQWKGQSAISNARMLTGAADTIPFGLYVQLDGDTLEGNVYPSRALKPDDLLSAPKNGMPLKGRRLGNGK